MSSPPFFTLFNSSLYHIFLPYLEFPELLRLIRCHRDFKMVLFPWMIKCKFWHPHINPYPCIDKRTIEIFRSNVNRLTIDHMTNLITNTPSFSHFLLLDNIHTLYVKNFVRKSWDKCTFFSFFPNLIYLQIGHWQIGATDFPDSLQHLHIHTYQGPHFFTKNELPCNLKCLIIDDYHPFPHPEHLEKNTLPSSLTCLQVPYWDDQSSILPPFLTHLEIGYFSNFKSVPIPMSIQYLCIRRNVDMWVMYGLLTTCSHLCHIENTYFVAKKSNDWKIERADSTPVNHDELLDTNDWKIERADNTPVNHDELLDTPKKHHDSYPISQVNIDWTKVQCWKNKIFQ